MQYMFYRAIAFNRNLSNLCVSNIASIPAGFDYNSGVSGQTAPQPKWGTCPVISSRIMQG